MAQHHTPHQRRPRLRVVAILEENGQVLLVPHQSRGTGDLVWFLPGGDLPHGESLRVATERAVQEETGYHVRATDLRGIFEDVQAYRSFHSLCFIYAARVLGGEIKVSAEGVRPQWFDVQDCPSLRLYPPFSQWDNLTFERFSSQRWDGAGRMVGVVINADGEVLLCRRGDSSRTWWPLRLELGKDEQPIRALARLCSRGPQSTWQMSGEPRVFQMRATVAAIALDGDSPAPEIDGYDSYNWTDPALLTTYNMDPAVRRVVYDVLDKLQE